VELEQLRDTTTRLREEIARVIVGQKKAVDLLLVALLSEGHVLLEGLPGTAKTLLARTFAATLSLGFKRIQFTPDLMPGDVTGTNLFDFQSNEFRLTRGPVFTEILLADEINRTPPKTQAALLEAMQERAVTIDGTTHSLGSGFMVVATQNPIEHEGTYPLPEAQLDRFLVKIPIGYPSQEDEISMAQRHGHRAGITQPEVEPVADLDWIVAARERVSQLELAAEVIEYVVQLVRATREHVSLSMGASPRSVNMLCFAARALAALRGREYVIPDDVKSLFRPVIAHRVQLAPGAEIEGTTAAQVVKETIEQIAAPR